MFKKQPIYLKIDKNSPNEPPRSPEDEVSFLDKAASFLTAEFRKSTCDTLRQAFNNLCKSDKVANEHGTPHTVQILYGLKHIESEITRMTSALEAGGVASMKALREAKDFLTQDLEKRVLQFN